MARWREARGAVRADGNDLSFVTATLADRDGLLVPRAKNCIRFALEGPGRIVAVDNDDATSHASFQDLEREAYNGLCLAIVRTHAGEAGVITVTVQSEGLEPAALRITSLSNN
jgi:beta-galactosidase